MRLVLNASVAINQKYKNWKQHQEMYNHKKYIKFSRISKIIDILHLDLCFY